MLWQHRRDAVDVAVAAAVELVDCDGEFTCVGVRNAVQVVEASGLRAAQFRQVTSRAGHPHLHVHEFTIEHGREPTGLEQADLQRAAWQSTRTGKADLPALDVLERQ